MLSPWQYVVQRSEKNTPKITKSETQRKTLYLRHSLSKNAINILSSFHITSAQPTYHKCEAFHITLAQRAYHVDKVDISRMRSIPYHAHAVSIPRRHSRHITNAKHSISRSHSEHITSAQPTYHLSLYGTSTAAYVDTLVATKSVYLCSSVAILYVVLQIPKTIQKRKQIR